MTKLTGCGCKQNECKGITTTKVYHAILYLAYIKS